MKKSIMSLLLICLTVFTLVGCSQTSSVSTPPASSTPAVNTPSTTDPGNDTPTTRTVTDFAGNVVEIPQPEDIKRVIITSSPVPSTLFDVMKGSDSLVGASASTFTWGNEKVLDLIVPNWRNINTTFITGNAINVEEVMALDPDLIIVYGADQSSSLYGASKNIASGVLPFPVIDLFEQNRDNEQTTLNRDRIMREIFGVEGDDGLAEEWEKANARVEQSLAEATGSEQIRALMIMNNTGTQITVRGIGTYGDSWILKSGMVNVANVSGDGIEVSLEQIYQWNPEIIILQGGKSEKEYLDNTIDGQDWSQIDAFKNGRIYYAPKGISNWAAPNADSPMMARWMVMKAYPDTYPEDEFLSELIEYYQRRYNVKITEELALEIIWPNGSDTSNAH